VPHYAAVTGLGSGGVGVLVAAYPAGTLLAALPSGAFFDRFGARRTLVLAMVLMSASTFVFGWSSAAGVLIVARFVQGIGGSFAWTAGLASIAIAAPAERRGRYLGIVFSAAVAGAILGPAFGALASRLGIGPVFSAAAVLAAVIIAFRGLLPPRADAQAIGLRRTLEVARTPGIARGMWLTTVAGIGLGALDVLAPLRLNTLGASADVIAAAFLVGGLLEACLSPFVGRLSDRHGPRYTVAVSLALCMVTSVLVPLVARAAPTAVTVALCSLAFGTLFVPAAAMVSHGADVRGIQPGLVFGLTNLAWASGQGLSAGVSGFVADATSYVVPFAAVAVVCLVSLAANRSPDQG
jgi:MFS family permease